MVGDLGDPFLEPFRDPDNAQLSLLVAVVLTAPPRGLCLLPPSEVTPLLP